jgi:transcriptional regulator with XRE-family HTH domain/quercetin dioxygenase-like cupin family protein
VTTPDPPPPTRWDDSLQLPLPSVNHARKADPVSPSAVPPIGGRLREERTRRGVSVRGLARDIGVSASLISQIETNKSSPSVSTLYAITTALGISIEDLFGGGPADGRDADAEAVSARGDASLDGAVPATVARAEIGTLEAGGVGTGGPGTGGVDGAELPAGGAEAGGPGSGHRAVGPNRQRRIGPVVEPNMREILTLDSGVTWELLGQIPNTHVDFLLITYQPGGSSSSSGLLMRHSGAEYGYVISGELTLTLGFDKHRLTAGDAVSFDSTLPHAYRNDGVEPAVGVWFVLERFH